MCGYRAKDEELACVGAVVCCALWAYSPIGIHISLEAYSPGGVGVVAIFNRPPLLWHRWRFYHARTNSHTTRPSFAVFAGCFFAWLCITLH